jgi:hypothetical protein
MSQLPIALVNDLDALGGSGWVGAGLLGLVLGWLLLQYLPKKDRDAAESQKASALHVESICSTHAATLKELISTHASAAKETAERCEVRSERQREDYKESLAGIAVPLGRAVEAMCSYMEKDRAR